MAHQGAAYEAPPYELATVRLDRTEDPGLTEQSWTAHLTLLLRLTRVLA